MIDMVFGDRDGVVTLFLISVVTQALRHYDIDLSVVLHLGDGVTRGREVGRGSHALPSC